MQGELSFVLQGLSTSGGYLPVGGTTWHKAPLPVPGAREQGGHRGRLSPGGAGRHRVRAGSVPGAGLRGRLLG